MIKLSPKTLVKLASLINEETIYRSGPMLVELFNEVGFRDVYGRGFPSRLDFTKDHLGQINGRIELEKIIRTVFNPREFGDAPEKFESSLSAFNSELKFDGWNIFWDDSLNDISFKRVTPASAFSAIVNAKPKIDPEQEFLKKEFADVRFDDIGLIPGIQEIVQDRVAELKRCLESKSPLSAIFLAGSILEAVLLSIATAQARLFCAAKAAPRDKKTGDVMPIHTWRLAALIDVAKELGYIKEDVHKFCHVVRDFRNYIHPYEQHSRAFSPNLNTAKICFQVLKGAIEQVRERVKGGVL